MKPDRQHVDQLMVTVGWCRYLELSVVRWFVERRDHRRVHGRHGEILLRRLALSLFYVVI
jgi:hypothetical protein